MTKTIAFLAQLIGNKFLVRTGTAKLISILVRLVFACQISPGVRIGSNLTLAYGGLGIIIHGDAVIGDNVSIGAHVTIGGNMGKGGVPKVGNRVRIGPGAQILGPVTIGDDVIIGANAVVLVDIPEGTTAVGVPARTLSTKGET